MQFPPNKGIPPPLAVQSNSLRAAPSPDSLLCPKDIIPMFIAGSLPSETGSQRYPLDPNYEVLDRVAERLHQIGFLILRKEDQPSLSYDDGPK